ncbi:MAG: hypothetical protein Q8P67_26150 [archaeon]|nr:hypothetical protein [archaeon]
MAPNPATVGQATGSAWISFEVAVACACICFAWKNKHGLFFPQYFSSSFKEKQAKGRAFVQSKTKGLKGGKAVLLLFLRSEKVCGRECQNEVQEKRPKDRKKRTEVLDSTKGR